MSIIFGVLMASHGSPWLQEIVFAVDFVSFFFFFLAIINHTILRYNKMSVEANVNTPEISPLIYLFNIRKSLPLWHGNGM